MFNKIKLGFFSFGGVTKAGQHASYNFWHMYDHIPENMALEGVVLGSRWVRPPAYQKVSTVNDPNVEKYQYMTLYLMQEPADRALKDFLDLGPQTEAVGRFHQHRTSYMGGPYMFIKGYASPRVLVSPGAIPYRPNKGILVSVSDPTTEDGVMLQKSAEWLDQVHLPDMLTVKHVAGIYWFRMLPKAPTGRTGPQSPMGRSIRVYYLDGDPLETIGDVKKKLPEWKKAGRYPDPTGAYKLVLNAPMQTIPQDSTFEWFEPNTEKKKK